MFTLSFQSIFLGMSQIFLMGLCGYLLYKGKIVQEEGLNLLTRLLINFLLPCFFIYQFSTSFETHELLKLLVYPVLAIIIIFAGFVISGVIARFSPLIKAKKEFVSIVTFQNSGYIPLLVVASLFDGSEGQYVTLCIIMYIIGFNLIFWSLGLSLMSQGKDVSIDWRKILNPPLVTIVIMLFLVYGGWHRSIPTLILKPAELFHDCVLPLAMIVIGGNLATLKHVRWTQAETWLAATTKLILFPLLALGVIYFFHIRGVFGLMMIIETAMPPAITLSIIARYNHFGQQVIDQCIFLSYLLSLVTVPFFLWAYVRLVQGF